MSDYATKQDVQEIVEKAIATDVQKIVDRVITKAVTDLSEVIAGFAQQVDERFNSLEARADSHDTQFKELRERIGKHDERFNHLLDTLDAFLGRLDNNETNDLARDAQFERLLAWAKKVSKKTGIPLEGF